MLDFETSNSKLEENYFFLENYVTSKGAVSHNILYYQPLPITRYQVRFYVISILRITIVSTAFKRVLWENKTGKTLGLDSNPRPSHGVEKYIFL